MTGSNPAPEGAAPLVAWEQPVEATGPAPGIDFAPHGPRLAAYLIDGLLIYLVIAIVSVAIFVPWAMLGHTLQDDPLTGPTLAVAGLLWFLLILVITFGYFPFFWARSGQTPGMRPFRLWVVRDRDGSAIGWKTALLRLVGLYVASAVFYLGFIWIFIDKRHRGWQDLIAGTLVVRRSGPG